MSKLPLFKIFASAVLLAGLSGLFGLGAASPAAAQACTDPALCAPGARHPAGPSRGPAPAPQINRNVQPRFVPHQPPPPVQNFQNRQSPPPNMQYRRYRHDRYGHRYPYYVQPPVILDQGPVYVEPQPYYVPGRWVFCARETGVCDVPYPTRVRYGRSGYYTYLDVSDSVFCGNNVFGDPAPGLHKSCWYMSQ